MNTLKLLKSTPHFLACSFRRNICLSIILALVFTSSTHTELKPLPGDYGSNSNLNNHADADHYVKMLDDPNTYEWLICGTNSWEDLKNYLPEAKIAGVTVSVLLLPPFQSTPVCTEGTYSEPFGQDYILWATEIASLSLRYSNLNEYGIEDLQENLNLGYLTQNYIDSMITTGKSINPLLQFDTLIPTPKTYYVSNSGNDNNSGLSQNSAWETISKVNGFAFAKGVSILFNKGDRWAETLTIPRDSLTFGAYGTGDLPTITGSGERDKCIALNNKNYITIQDLHLTNTSDLGGDRGIIDNWDNSGTARVGLTIRDSIIDSAGTNGIRLYLADASGIWSGIEIYDNVFSYIDDSQAYAVVLVGDAGSKFTSPKVYRNEVHHYYHGVGYRQTIGGEIYDNYFHTTSGIVETAVLVGTNSSDIDIYRNLFQDIYGEALWVGISNIDNVRFYYNVMDNITTNAAVEISNGTDSVFIHNNTFYGGDNSAIVLGGGGQVTNIFIKNNIIDGQGTSNIGWYNSSTFTSDYNIWDENQGFYDGSSRNWTYWTRTLSLDANGYYEDAGLNADLTLGIGSIAIDNGVNLGTTYANGLDINSAWTQTIITTNQNIYGSGWEIGTYIY